MQQSMGQHQLLLPRMLQAVELLALPDAELEAWLAVQAESNEALELCDPRRELQGPPRSAAAAREATEAHDAMLHNQPAHEGDLVRALHEELALRELEGPLSQWVHFLVECLDPNGFLQADDETLLRLAHDSGLERDPERLSSAIAVLQSLEPRGVGARGPIEALLLQLDPADADFELLRRLLIEFLEDVAKNKLPHVARALGIGLDQLHVLLERLRALELHPAAALHDEGAPVLHPEVLVEVSGDSFEVRLDGAGRTGVRIDEGVERLARDRRQEPQVRRYLRGKLERARWIVSAMEQRDRTLLRVARRVFDHQRAFLRHGPGHLSPLRMNQVADDLGLHVSTVSRAVAGKHAQTPFGILPLRHFFQTPVGEGEETARDDLRERVRALFGAEDPREPLSDDAVVAELEKSGIKLARRTVAKYRRELGIASSYRRREYR